MQMNDAPLNCDLSEHPRWVVNGHVGSLFLGRHDQVATSPNREPGSGHD
jgi:hypothetical protein